MKGGIVLQEYMITFPNTHSAIQGEKILIDGGLTVGVMPMPTAVSAGCGICLRIPAVRVQCAKDILSQASIATDAYYRIDTDGDGVSYQREG